MKIHGNSEITTQINRSTQSETKRPGDKAASLHGGSQDTGEGAIVDFSRRSKEIQQIQQVLQSEPDVRADKVRAVKEKIEQGTYEIDADGTADNMLKAFFDDMT